jgi:hypothetical protein
MCELRILTGNSNEVFDLVSLGEPERTQLVAISEKSEGNDMGQTVPERKAYKLDPQEHDYLVLV